MAIRDWQDVIKIVTDSGGEYPQVQLYLLMQRLQALSDHPDCMGAIAAAVADMGRWYLQQADALEQEGLRRDGAEILPFKGREK